MYQCWFLNFDEWLWIHNTVKWGVYRNSPYYLGNFSINLKPSWKHLLEREEEGERAEKGERKIVRDKDRYILIFFLSDWKFQEDWFQQSIRKRAPQVVLVVKNLPANAGDMRDTCSISVGGRSPGGEHGNPLEYSCLENPMDRGAWQATVYSVAKSQTQLKWLSLPTRLQS